MSRRDELIKAIGDKTLTPMVDEMVYLEEQLDMLRGLPKIKVHPKDPTIQKATPAAKMYKEYLQQYLNIVRILLRLTGADENEEDSPLRAWVRSHMEEI